MSGFLPSNSQAPFLPTSEVFPEDFGQLLIRLTQIYQEMALRLNVKDIAQYETNVELLNGQQFSGTTPQTKRFAFRTTLATGILATGANNVAHNIAFPTPNTYHFTRIYGVIEDTTAPLYVPIPNDNVHLEVNATNAVITIPAAYNGYSGIVVLEYVKTD